MTQLEKYEAVIADSGSKLTKQRRQILKIILDNSFNHFSAEELYEVVKKVDESIGIATVYRTLELFESLKFLRNVKIKKDGIKHYDVLDLDEKNHFHHHLICLKCNNIIEIADELHCYEAFIQKKYGFNVSDHDLIFYGTCPACEEASNKTI